MRSGLHITFILTALLASHCAFAQKAALRKGDRCFADMSFLEAIQHYERAFDQGAESIPHARRLAECHWNLRDPDGSSKWYALVAASPEATPEDIYRHAELLRNAGKYQQSDDVLELFALKAPGDSRGQRKASSMQKLTELMDRPGLAHKVIKIGINSSVTDMSPFIHDGRFIFASARMPEDLVKRHHTWNDQPFLNLYHGAIDAEGAITDVKPLREGVNTDHHESNAIISADGSEFFFNRNGRSRSPSGDVTQLQLYEMKSTDGGWSREKPFIHNDPDHSYGHPALTRDGLRLYFTSDRPGGFGGKDIWYCDREKGGEWRTPVNAGPSINTEGDEMFPYVHGNFLYLASDGHLGLGGLDIFRMRMRAESAQLENLGMPINGPRDDFGICFDSTGDMGFFVSDRAGSIGGEDIFMFRTHSLPEEERVWMGRVLDERTARPVPHLTMQLIDEDRREIDRAVTDQNGIYEFKDPGLPAFVSTTIPGGAHMEVPLEEIAVSKHGNTELPDVYLNSVMDLPVNAIIRDAITDAPVEGVTVTVEDSRDGTVLYHGVTDDNGIAQGQIPDRQFGDDLALDVTFNKAGYFARTVRVDFRVLMFLEQVLAGPEESMLTPMRLGADIGDAIGLRPIFFQRGGDVIDELAAKELELVVRELKQDPTLKIEIRSHTDSRASTTFNDALSQRRSEVTREHLIARGIQPERLVAKGLGERHLLNRCKDGVECTEEEHHRNRRTEFIVIACEGCRQH